MLTLDHYQNFTSLSQTQPLLNITGHTARLKGPLSAPVRKPWEKGILLFPVRTLTGLLHYLDEIKKYQGQQVIHMPNVFGETIQNSSCKNRIWENTHSLRTFKRNNSWTYQNNIFEDYVFRDFPGGTVSPCRGHAFNPWSGKIPHATEQLSLCTTTTKAHVPRAWALQQKKPPQCEPQALQWRVTLACCN